MSNAATAKLIELAELIEYLPDSKQEELAFLMSAAMPIWVPLPGPQSDAYYCTADILYYGGQAGGGKTDLLLGLALTAHSRSKIYRREGTQNTAMIDRLLFEILKSKSGWNGKDSVWRGEMVGERRHIEFGACKDPGSEQKDQGKKYDFKGFDEITHFLESQFRFLCGWNRGGKRNRIVCTGNPPTNAEGQWVIKFWGPWLDPDHPNPAQPGELRWYSTIDGEDKEFPDSSQFTYKNKVYRPKSRTFIRSGVQDNVFMVAENYEDTLAALPEPLRSQMLEGNFFADSEDSAWQVIPSAWVDLAMKRWSPDGKKGQMSSIGADIARGGPAETIVACRYENWYDSLNTFPGMATPDGPTAAGLIVSCLRHGAPIHVDVIGVGGSVYDWLKSNEIQVVPVNGAGAVPEGVRDKSGKLKFRNKRAEIWWKFREALDPKTGKNIALPFDSQLKADLCAPHWFLTPHGIQIESKEQLIRGPRLHKNMVALGRSPDRGDAVVYCSIDTPKMLTINEIILQNSEKYDPLTYGLNPKEEPFNPLNHGL